jgi:hypothetical protein
MLERYAPLTNLIWAGSGARLQRELLERHARKNEIVFAELAHESNAESPAPGPYVWRLAPAEANLAQQVAALALQRFESDKIQSPHSLHAIYVRPSDAELNQQCR